MSTAADALEPALQFWQRKSRGLLLGAVCGDALSAPLSGKGPIGLRALGALEDGAAPLRHSAAAELMLAAASFHALRREVDSLNAETLTYALALTWWREHDRPGYRREDQDRFSCALDLELPAGRMSAGPSCDPAPLIAGVLALLQAAPAQVAALAATSVTATGEPSGVRDGQADSERTGAARTSASALARLLASDPLRELDADQWLERLREVADPTMVPTLDLIGQLVPHGTPAAVAHGIAPDGGARSAIAIAVLAFLACPTSVQGCVRFAVETGGRNTVAAALAGGLAGARLGAGAVPRAWVGRLEDPARVFDIADRLALHRVRDAS